MTKDDVVRQWLKGNSRTAAPARPALEVIRTNGEAIEAKDATATDNVNSVGGAHSLKRHRTLEVQQMELMAPCQPISQKTWPLQQLGRDC
jgi:hypothetical protein